MAFKKGDYVLATKYHDGDLMDRFLIRDNPDGTRVQIDYYTIQEEEDAAHFARNLEPPEWRRTGDCICSMCGNHYGQHRIAWPWFPLHRICDGSYVKL